MTVIAPGGLWALTGDQIYSDGITIGAGTLQLGNGGTSGHLTGAIVDNSVFAINRSDTVTLGNTISGTGSLRQIGLGGDYPQRRHEL
ncbi:fibronectin-binding autotransporter adhesin [Rhizobiales bacterium GAS191]|nr:fibronectin-binding autotransporter adhesin [Rhizobiales bacterium GAS191]